MEIEPKPSARISARSRDFADARVLIGGERARARALNGLLAKAWRRCNPSLPNPNYNYHHYYYY